MITEIVPNLYIGTIWDAIHDKTPWSLIIEVAEFDNFTKEEWHDLFCQNRPVLHYPFMEYSYEYPDGAQSEWVNPKKLARISGFILDSTIRKEPILIACAAGIERSPLAVVWYLYHYFIIHSSDNDLTWEECYNLVKEKRPIVQDRTAWIRKNDQEDYKIS